MNFSRHGPVVGWSRRHGCVGMGCVWAQGLGNGHSSQVALRSFLDGEFGDEKLFVYDEQCLGCPKHTEPSIGPFS